MTDSNNIDKALAYLGTSISALIDASKAPVDSTMILQNIPKRSLSGDHINGGTIVNFASKGIKDDATTQQLTITDSEISVNVLSVGSIKGNLAVENTLTAKTIKVDVLEVRQIKTDTTVEKSSPLSFVATANDTLYGKGLLFSGMGYTKQLIFAANPDKFYSTENLGLAKDKAFSIDSNVVLSATELGLSVVKSNLREVGRLRGLIVDGDVNIGQWFYFNSSRSRFGLGTDQPNAALSVSENGTEVLLGTGDDNTGIVGTHASTAFNIVTDNTSRINVGTSGNILLGNRTQAPIEVSVHGKLAVGVKTLDPRVDLHVSGAIKFNDKIHQYAATVPGDGTFNRGDIVWNSEPDVGRCVGWVCVRAGTPGAWAPFGDIKQIG